MLKKTIFIPIIFFILHLLVFVSFKPTDVCADECGVDYCDDSCEPSCGSAECVCENWAYTNFNWDAEGCCCVRVGCGCQDGCDPPYICSCGDEDPPVVNNPIGFVDSVTCTTDGIRFAGWTGDKDDPLTSNSLHIYFTKGATTLGWNAGASSNHREPAVCNALSGPACDECASSNPPQCQHGFDHTIRHLGSFDFLDNTTYTYTAYSINLPPTGSNQAIKNGTFTCPPPVSCDIAIADGIVSVGDTITQIPQIISEIGGFINSIEFAEIVDTDNIMSLLNDDGDPEDPYTDNSPAFSVDILGNNTGADATIRATATMDDGTTTCTATADITVYEPAWFQTQGAGLTSMSVLQSILPADEILVKDGSHTDPSLTRTPGVVVYNYSSYNLGGGSPSSENWLAKSEYQGFAYNYTFFENKLAPGIFNPNVVGPVGMADWDGGDIYNGYEWYFYDSGDLVINEDINFGDKKVVLFVKGGNLEIGGKINVNDGKGFFMAVVEGDIIVDASVGGDISEGSDPHLEGLFLASNGVDGTFQTLSQTPSADTQLYIRGSVVADVFRLNRDLGAGNTSPTEFFEYAPDLMFHYPKALGAKTMQWKEVAP